MEQADPFPVTEYETCLIYDGLLAHPNDTDLLPLVATALESLTTGAGALSLSLSATNKADIATSLAYLLEEPDFFTQTIDYKRCLELKQRLCASA